MRKMKDSGLEWIGEIPSDWDVTRIGYESWIRARLGWKGLKAEEYVDEGFAFLSAFNIVDDKLQWENLNFINQQRYDESPEIKLKKGDILLVKDGAGIGKCARIDSLPIGAATTNGSLAVISTHAKLSYRYLYFYLLSPIFQNYIYRLMNGMGVPHLSQEELRKIQIPFPPLPEQKRIANFLDGKCADIDQIRADIEKQIEVLTDYKKSVITEAVTKGLDPKAKMKDSGIEWIGKIPEHWDCRPIKYGFKLISGSTPKSDNMDFWDGDVIWITPADYKTEDKYVCQGKRNISYQGFLSCSTNIVPKGSLIFSKRAPIGTVAINSVPLCTNQGCLSCVPKVCSSSLYFYFVFIVYEEVFNLLGSGTTFKEISATTFSNVKLPYPSINEQKKIAAYLDEKCSEIDATIAEKRKQLETLEEYKKSLIFEYVTGKKEVV